MKKYKLEKGTWIRIYDNGGETLDRYAVTVI